MSSTQTPTARLVVPENGQILAAGLGFVEGPVALDDEHIAVASINRGHIYRIPLDGATPELLIETGGGPNCVAVGANSELWIAQNGGTVMPSKSTVPAVPSIQRWTTDLETVHAEAVFGPSDCVIGPDGRLWFTDPADHALTGTAKPGCLRTYDPFTGDLHTELDTLQFPNGLAFGADPDELYVAETTPGVVRRYRVGPTGCHPDGWEFPLPHGKPDGLAVDSEGWLWVAGSTGDNLIAVDRAGNIRRQLSFGDRVLVTSVCFAGPDLATLVVTIAKGGTVMTLPAPNPGLPLPVWRTT
jgi:gluconolactonase